MLVACASEYMYFKNLLYYYTELPVKVGYLALPWIAFIITLVLSLLLSKTTKSL